VIGARAGRPDFGLRRSVGRDAFHPDYHVFVAGDARAAYEPDLNAGSLEALDLNCAILATTGEVAAAWREYAEHG
jgi:ureidoacrylate peracid hydrolase